ncbi:MAG TPA: zinc ribbon domain-containing protein, partial [Herpetosiphonaceae bacterium]
MSHSFDCQHCGAIVPAGALACPECGADDQTGWSPRANLLLPDDWPAEELLGVGGRRRDLPPRSGGSQLALRAVASLVLASLVLSVAGPWGALAALLVCAGLIWY